MSGKSKNTMTQEEIEQWDELYQYVKKEILMYNQKQGIPTNIILRLKGLQKGKLMANNNSQDYAEYSFKIILYTFKLYKQNILNAISSITFKDEMGKFLYIARIVENNINDVYLRVANAKKSQEKTEVINIDNIYHEGAEYQKKINDSKVNEKFNELW